MLENIKGPEDIKELTYKQQKQLAMEIRRFLVEKISVTGGHLGSNLGIVELTMALHKNFDSPKDKLIFDVGHQGYVHKILTGRHNRFDTLRQYNGLSGFLKMSESKHDVWEAGHSSTSISAACGFALARDLNLEDNHVVAIIGDGSMTNGMSLEALNHLVELNTKIIIILNDNEMSISSNVGFINAILQNLENSNQYKNTKIKVKDRLSHNRIGRIISQLISVTKRRFKQEIQGDAKTFFSVLGYDYIGTVDGHDFKNLDQALADAKACENSVIVHVKTQKGKGYQPAVENKWHGVSPFNIETGESLSSSSCYTYSKYISELIIEKMKKDDDIVVITPAMLDGSELNKMQELFPKRVTDVGIAEEHGITLAAALGLSGKKPFVSIYSTFFQRGYDQMFHDVVRQKANVVIGIDRAGLVGADGETHQGIYDISYLSHQHDLVICQGSNAREISSLINFAFDYNGPVAIRYPRGGKFTVDDVHVQTDNIKLGTWVYNHVREDSKLTIICYGEMVKYISDIVQTKGLPVTVVNSRFIKPLDEEFLMQITDNKILVVEEHTHIGSLYFMILDFYNQKNNQKQINFLNLGDRFVEQGQISQLYQEADLDEEGIVNRINKLIK